jgi:septin 7
MSDTDSFAGAPQANGLTNGSADPMGINGRLSSATSGAPPNGGVVRKKLMGYVGFANLPNQVHRKSVRKGFQFTAMVVGELRLSALFEIRLVV